MGFASLLLTAVGLSMDAFAVALCKGLKMKRINYNQSLAIAISFGLFQGLMPLLGWILGKQFEQYITAVDHWVAFILLAFIGGKMVYESFQKEDESCPAEFSLKELLTLSLATSIDAMAVGITFAFLQVEILPSCLIICATTLIISFCGVLLGHRFGSVLKSKAELAGGIILILIGAKILLEHLGVL